jgi:hypothetical protein
MRLRARHEGDFAAAPVRASSVRLSWSSSYWVIALLAVLIGLLSVAGSIGLDWAIHGLVRPVYASDILEGAVAALVSGLVLVRMQSRRRELLIRMQIVEDVNHHVRNALTAITFSSALRQDPELNAQVKEACDRIDWVLNDALVKTAGGRGSEPIQAGWRSGRQMAGEVYRRR